MNECPEDYFPKEEQINQISHYICKKCYQNCKTCSEEGNSQQMKCNLCKSNQIKYNDNCFDMYDSSLKIFYEPETNNYFLTSCKDKFDLYIKEDSNECIPLPEEDEGYYISNEEIGLLSKCHENCMSCKNGQIKNDMGYLFSMEYIKCKDSNNSQKTMIKVDNNCFIIIYYNESTIIFDISETNPDFHLDTCRDFGKILNINKYECINESNIIDELNYTNENTNELINNSLDEPMDIKTNMDELFESHKEILESNDKCTFESFNQGNNFSDYIEIIKNDIISHSSLCKVINTSNFIISIVSSDKIEPEEQIKKGISAVDLGNCTSVIKEHYNIPIEENLIILNMETKVEENLSNEGNSFKLGKINKLGVCDILGRKLSLSVCKEEIKILKYIGDIKELDFNSAKSFSEKGIDVFNAADKFFNDICHNYDIYDNKDIIINDRRTDIYKNATFCQYGCKYKGVNYNLMVANCICKSNLLQKKEEDIEEISEEKEILNFKSLRKAFLENIFSCNLEVLKCYNLVLNPKILIHNIGFYALSSMFVLQIILLFVYLMKRLNSIKYFMLKFENKRHNKNDRKKKINIIKDKNFKNLDNKNNEKIKVIGNPTRKIKKKRKSILSNKEIKLLYNKNEDEKINNLNKNNEQIIDNKSKVVNYASINDLYLNNKINKNNDNENHNMKQDSNKLFLSIYDLQDMDYEEALLYDKRGYLKIYWGFLVDSQIILGSFCTDNNLDLFVIKLSFLIFTFQISFFLNAFFYSDEYISNSYHNDGVLDFFSGLSKSIYSFVATLITSNLLRILSNSKSELMKLIKEKRKYKYYIYLIQLKLIKLGKKLVFYFILVYIFSLFFVYYVSSFCAVYRNSQKYWFYGCLESFGMDTLVAIGICIFLAFFRYISIKKHIKCFYILANIISTFL